MPAERVVAWWMLWLVAFAGPLSESWSGAFAAAWQMQGVPCSISSFEQVWHECAVCVSWGGHVCLAFVLAVVHSPCFVSLCHRGALLLYA